MIYFIRNMDWKLTVAIVFLSVFGLMGWMEMHEGGSILNTVTPSINNGVTILFQVIVNSIEELGLVMKF